jgi:hypothetical protein
MVYKLHIKTQTRVYAVHPYALGGDLKSGAARQLVHGRFGDLVRDGVLVGSKAGDARHVDNALQVGLLQVWHARLGQREGGPDVDVHGRVKLLLCAIEQVLWHQHPSVIHQAVQACWVKSRCTVVYTNVLKSAKHLTAQKPLPAPKQIVQYL